MLDYAHKGGVGGGGFGTCTSRLELAGLGRLSTRRGSERLSTRRGVRSLAPDTQDRPPARPSE